MPAIGVLVDVIVGLEEYLEDPTMNKTATIMQTTAITMYKYFSENINNNHSSWIRTYNILFWLERFISFWNPYER
ncbi:MAG: hypothetical protein QXZ41_02400 [Ignisphaera sp.]